jgi:nitronate monooxygenase
MREAAARKGKADCMQMWAGQAARLARAGPAGDVTSHLWRDAEKLLNFSNNT